MKPGLFSYKRVAEITLEILFWNSFEIFSLNSYFVLQILFNDPLVLAGM